MYDASFDHENSGLSRRDRNWLWVIRLSAAVAVILAASAEAQMPDAPVLQNAWASPGMVGAINIGGGSGGTVYAGAVSFAAGSRLQLSGGLGYQTRTGARARTVYGLRAAVPFGGATSAFGFAAFAGVGGGSGTGSGGAVDSLASTTQVPIGASLAWRRGFSKMRGVSVYASPSYVLYSGGSKSGGLVRLGLGADLGLTNTTGVTVGAELGQTRPRGVGGPSGVLFGLGVSYAFGRR
jgi:hypothetical protein